jgi:iron-sulfur cluster assembly protein
MAYSDKVLDHYENPRNVGSLDKDEGRRRHRRRRRAGVRRRDEAADQGRTTAHRRREVQDLRLRLGDRVVVARHRDGSRARRSTSRRRQIKNTQIVEELSLPPVKIHCSVLAEDAIKAAIEDYRCTGYTYVFEWAEQVRASDREFTAFGVSVVVDPKSLVYLAGMQLDFVRGMMGHGFKFNNPNVKGDCGCGESVQF